MNLPGSGIFFSRNPGLKLFALVPLNTCSIQIFVVKLSGFKRTVEIGMEMAFIAFFLLFLANGAPILAARLFRGRFAHAIDGGYTAPDGNPWLGPSKTFRGVFASVMACTAIAPAFGLSLHVGAIFAGSAMLGDLLTSFIKRRLGLKPSSQLFGVDHALEAFMPLAACAGYFHLEWKEVLALTVGFWLFGNLLSKLLFSIGIRKHPY